MGYLSSTERRKLIFLTIFISVALLIALLYSFLTCINRDAKTNDLLYSMLSTMEDVDIRANEDLDVSGTPLFYWTVDNLAKSYSEWGSAYGVDTTSENNIAPLIDGLKTAYSSCDIAALQDFNQELYRNSLSLSSLQREFERFPQSLLLDSRTSDFIVETFKRVRWIEE